MQIHIAHKSIIGTREEQQDAYYAVASGDMAFAVVCDGMGGTSGGSAASRTAVAVMKDLLRSKDQAEPFPDFFLRAVDLLDESVVELQGQTEASFSGTTIVAAAVARGRLYWMSVGDSRLYIIRGKEIVQATRDHNFALSLKQWSAKEIETAKLSPGNHRTDALISFIGIGGVKIYDLNEMAFILQPGDKILLTTDGLTKALGDGEILALLSSDQLAADLASLLKQATEKSQGAQDNTTCVLMRVSDGGKQSAEE